jgi:hypothetical protein
VQNATHYWFPAKRYGWGWGLPITWQGWLTFACFFGLVAADFLIFPPRKAFVAFLFSLAAPSALFVAVGWLKGEPPRWRWGDE